MAKTHGGHSFRPRVRTSSPPPTAEQSSPPAASSTLVPTVPTPRRYDTRVGPTPPSPAHPRPSWRARTSGPGESSDSKPQEPYSPPNQGPAGDLPLDLSPASIIRRPIFHCSPITENSNCSTRDLHSEVYFDLPAFAEDLKLKTLCS